jgi:RES domain-containing protein
MILYRITKSKYAADLSGYGAAIHPGRWNKRGTSVLYTGMTAEIALLETLVQLPNMLTPRLDMVTIQIPDKSCFEYSIADLPENWSNYPAPTILAEIGQRWVNENKYLGLIVPSCIIPTAKNVVLNCQHVRYREVSIVDQKPFQIDKRLIRTT